MGDKDIVSKEILKNIARDVARYILHIEIDENMELIDKEFTRIEKRDADLLFKNGDEIIHIEIQNNNHKEMHNRMLRYLSDILFEYEALTVKQYLLYIGKARCSMKNRIENFGLNFNYDIIDINDISCESFLQSDDPSAVVLSILCDFEGKDKQMVVNTIIKKLLKLSKDEQSFRSYLKMVEILSTNRNLEENVRKGEEMLTVDIEKMPSFNIGFDRGIQKGLQKGIQEGTENGVKKVALGMLKLNLDMEIIQKSTGLSLEEIEKLKKSLKN